MAKGKRSNYLKKAAKFATGQGKQRKPDKGGSTHKNAQQVGSHVSQQAVLVQAVSCCLQHLYCCSFVAGNKRWQRHNMIIVGMSTYSGALQQPLGSMTLPWCELPAGSVNSPPYTHACSECGCQSCCRTKKTAFSGLLQKLSSSTTQQPAQL